MSLSLALILSAAPFADLSAIDREVALFTGAPIGSEGGAVLPVDRRLRLRACTAPLALGWRTARRESVVVACSDPGGWRLFVPVRSGSGGGSDVAAIGRGEAVTIAVSGQGFSVSQPGEALDSGPVGGWIRVRTLATKAQPVRARIVRPGLVELPLP